MEQQPLMPIMGYFSDIHDPRIERNKLYPLHEVIVITILAVISMAQGWSQSWADKMCRNNGVGMERSGMT